MRTSTLKKTRIRALFRTRYIHNSKLFTPPVSWEFPLILPHVSITFLQLSLTHLLHHHSPPLTDLSPRPDQRGSVGWAWYCKAKNHWFNSWSGDMPGLWVRSLVRACTKGNRSMFLSLSFSLLSPKKRKEKRRSVPSMLTILMISHKYCCSIHSRPFGPQTVSSLKAMITSYSSTEFGKTPVLLS